MSQPTTSETRANATIAKIESRGGYAINIDYYSRRPRAERWEISAVFAGVRRILAVGPTEKDALRQI